MLDVCLLSTTLGGLWEWVGQLDHWPASCFPSLFALWHVQHQHGDVVILFISGQHPVNQVFQEPVGMTDDIWRRLAGDSEQFVQSRVQAPHAVLY